MSTTVNFNSLSTPSPKRPRPENEPPSDSSGAEDTNGQIDGSWISIDSDFRAKKYRAFDAFAGNAECVVAVGGGEQSGRHLGSAAPLHFTNAAAAAAGSGDGVVTTHSATDNDLLNNGDSGFQELNVPDDSTVINFAANESDTNLLGNGISSEESSLVANDEVAEEESKEYDDDDSISELSCGSDLSNMSGQDWKPISTHIKWIQMQMDKGTCPKEIIQQLTGEVISDDIDEITALRFIIRLLSESTSRSKLPNVNTIEDVISLIEKSSKIIVLTGAGVSVSCGIPDFRSRNGIYARLSKDYPDLPDPQSMFDIHYFKRNPYPFFKFAKEIYPGQFAPSPSHKFIKYIERKGRLLRNYSQNIDTLEKAAGIEKVITCHGSFATASCTNCGHKVESNAIKYDIFAQRIPLCPKCNTGENTDNSIMPVMKPDIVFFGEGLSDEFHNSMTIDKDECDLLIVIGSSLKVRPVALIPSSIPENVPQILINREPLNHFNFDVELLGDCDIIIKHLCERLGADWSEFCFSKTSDREVKPIVEAEYDLVNRSNEKNDAFQFVSPSRYIFKGAEVSDSAVLDYSDDSVNVTCINDVEENHVTPSVGLLQQDASVQISHPTQKLDDSLTMMGNVEPKDSLIDKGSAFSKCADAHIQTGSSVLLSENGPSKLLTTSQSVQCFQVAENEGLEYFDSF